MYFNTFSTNEPKKDYHAKYIYILYVYSFYIVSATVTRLSNCFLTNFVCTLSVVLYRKLGELSAVAATATFNYTLPSARQFSRAPLIWTFTKQYTSGEILIVRISSLNTTKSHYNNTFWILLSICMHLYMYICICYNDGVGIYCICFVRFN